MGDLLIPKAFLGYLYGRNFGDEDPMLDIVDEWVDVQGFDKLEFWKLYEVLIKAKIVRFVQNDSTVRLTPKGTLQAEKLGLATAHEISRNRDIRKRLMSVMADSLSSAGPTANIADLARSANLIGEPIIGNLQLLIDLGYGRWTVKRVQMSISPKVCSKAESLSNVA